MTSKGRYQHNKYCYQSILRLASLPPSHPLAPMIDQCARLCPQYHLTTFHILLHLYPTNPLLIETIQSSSRHPTHLSPFTTTVLDSKETSIILDNLAATTFRTHIYSDGSGIKGNVGSAAVWIKNGITHCTLQCHLGKLAKHTVYESELVGIILALEIVHKAGCSMPCPICISLDNQAAIKAPRLNNMASGQHLIRALTHSALHIQKACPSHQKTTLQWVVGHRDVLGNELADTAAKEATRGASSSRQTLPLILRTPLPLSISALHQQHLSTLKNLWSLRWKKSPCYPRLCQTDPALPLDSFLCLITKAALTRTQSSLLFQLHTRHIPLNLHLHCIKKATSSCCLTCEAPRETVHHFLLECLSYDAHREPLCHRWKHLSQDISFLLSDPKAIATTIDFIHATGRLQQTLSELSNH